MAALAAGELTWSERAPTSFQRKGPGGGGSRLAVLPGTRPSVRHGQLLLSSGLPSLDSVLGGGLAVGTLLLIGMQFNLPIKGYSSLVNIIGYITFSKVEKEEDTYGIYSNLLFKHFLAEGIVCGHNLFIASAKEEPADILKEAFFIEAHSLHQPTGSYKRFITMFTGSFFL